MKKQARDTKSMLFPAVLVVLALMLLTTCSQRCVQVPERAPTDTRTFKPGDRPAPAPEPEPEPEPVSDIAERTEAAVKKAFDIDSFTELLDNPETLLGYVTKVERVTDTRVAFTIHLFRDEVTKEALDRQAFVILSLVGQEVEDLNHVEVITADEARFGSAYRQDIPLLNR